MDTLDKLISSWKTMSTRRKEFFSFYNTQGLMGKEGCKIDGFLAQLGRDMAACKLETFNWADYQDPDTTINSTSNTTIYQNTMNKIEQICIHFQKGSCKYGEQCKENTFT